LQESHTVARFLDGVQLDTTIALVTRDLPVTLGDFIEANRVAVLNLVDLKEVLMSLGILNWLTLSRRVSNVVDVALIVSLCA
jgi:hypothetical protein